jgi:hypothetical protein
MSKCTHCETTGVVGVICDRCRIAELEEAIKEACASIDFFQQKLKVRNASIAELEAKIARLTSRGIEDMQFTIKELEAELAKHEWVSVEDRLPDDETEVLVLSMDDDETIFQMDLCSGRWRDECGQDVSGNPTHWMPIPALPEPPASKAETEMSNG